MTPSPHYRSHEHQRALVGCAADLDPNKHPRRYALYLARNKKEFVDVKSRAETKAEIRARQRATRENLAAQARELTHMTAREAAAALGITKHMLSKLRSEFALEFAGPVSRNQALLDRIEELAGKGLKIADIADQVGRATNYIARVVRENDFKRGRQTDLEA